MVLERKLGLKMIPGGPLEEVPRKYFAKNRIQRTSNLDNGSYSYFKKTDVWCETPVSTLAFKLALTPASGCIPNCVDADFQQ